MIVSFGSLVLNWSALHILIFNYIHVKSIPFSEAYSIGWLIGNYMTKINSKYVFNSSFFQCICRLQYLWHYMRISFFIYILN